MSRLSILFIGGDLGGAVPPAVAMAGELARRGHRIRLAGHRLQPSDLTDGIVAVQLAAIRTVDMARPSGRLGTTRALMAMSLGRRLANEVSDVIAADRPDVIVVDGVMISSLGAALRSGVPTAVLFHTFGSLWDKGMSPGPADVLLRPFGLSPRVLWGSAGALLLATDPVLDPAGHRATRADFTWLGTTERGAEPRPREPGEPFVLVSLSSAWLSGQAEVYRRIVAALAELPVRAMVTTGDAEIEGGLTGARNVEVRARVPHEQILPRADLVIGHGGHSTTLKALAHGVPLLILPMNPLSDQTMIARTIVEAGVGRRLSRRAKPAVIRDAVREILADQEITAAARRTGERLRTQDGAARGADAVLDLVR